jgi:hypothetical protein
MPFHLTVNIKKHFFNPTLAILDLNIFNVKVCCVRLSSLAVMLDETINTKTQTLLPIGPVPKLRRK